MPELSKKDLNPARVLHEFLHKAANDSKDKKTSIVLFNAMQEAEKNNTSLMRIFLYLFNLIDTVKKEVQYFSSEKQKGYQAILEEIEVALSNIFIKDVESPSTKWESATLLNDPEWLGLRTLPVIAADLEEIGVVLRSDFLSELKNEVNSWIEAVEKSNLPKDFMEFLLIKLRNIRDIIVKYCDYGSSGLKKEIYSVIGELTVNDEFDAKDRRPWIDILSEFSRKIRDPLDVIKITAEIVDKAKGYLPPGNKVDN